MAAAPQLDSSATHTYNDSARTGIVPDGASRAQTADLLERARARARAATLEFAGNVSPDEAVELIAGGAARLIDVRTPEERAFVGYVPNSIAVPWAFGTAFTRNPHFIRELERHSSIYLPQWFAVDLGGRGGRSRPFSTLIQCGRRVRGGARPGAPSRNQRRMALSRSTLDSRLKASSRIRQGLPARLRGTARDCLTGPSARWQV
jgi:rhodanese-related sulfurtransferase